jgi:phosphatidylethanolamine/phosphatidyl-N-methylethanolamine N-methyltransferase
VSPDEPSELDVGAVVRTYDRYAPFYDRLYGAVLEPGRRALSRAVHDLPRRNGALKLLEVGVGTGLTLPLYPAEAEITGIDVSEQMLSKARLRAQSMPNVRLVHMDAEHIDFPDGTFDCVTLPYVLSVTPEPDRLVREVRRVCRPDGYIVLVNHFSGSPFWWTLERAVKPLAARVGFRSEFGFERHVASHDWKVESVRTVNLLGLSRLVVLRNA